MNTIYNTQVDCTKLTIQEINELARDLKVWQNSDAMNRNKANAECFFTKFESDNEFYMRSKSAKKTVVTFQEFLKLKAL